MNFHIAGPKPSRAISRPRARSPLQVLGVLAVAAGTAAASLVGAPGASAASANNFGPTTAVPAQGTKMSGGTAYFMEGQSAPPTYIFPFISPQVCSTMNYGQLTYLMYRPLYWFGNYNQPTVDYNYSVANPPKFSNGDKTVTVTLKPWKWSNGEPVSSRDVEFWMNMMFANKDNWCDYTPGFFPDNVASMSYPNARTVVFHLKKSYNPTWYLYNELSQITPLPMAWDVTSASSPTPTPNEKNLPDTTIKGAQAVYNFLNKQAMDKTTWASSKYWSIVDGPWKLKSFTSTGEATFVPNPSYGGSPKPTLSKFVEVPFTSDEAILNELKSGGPRALQVAELPDDYIPQLQRIESEGYTAVNFPSFSFAYFPLNLGNPIFGPVFRQLYFRQAFQHLVDQQGWIQKILDGYGVPTYGPAPLAPTNHFAAKLEYHNMYPFSVSDAAKILKAHGWADVAPGKVAYCADPAKCGPGVKKGLKLEFGLLYQSGVVVTQEEMVDLKSQAAQVGINLELSSAPFAQVVGKAINCGPHGYAKPSSAQCSWTALNWGAGWVYAPDYEPTGESLFATGAGADFSGYSTAKADALIAATATVPESRTASSLINYEYYMAEQLPVVYFPTATGDPTAAAVDLISKHLGGFNNNVYTNLTPETWYLTK
ncbi:MAG: ABC transporter substrate-binding protein [Actinomycetota bacterium]|jgi:peptide/nickel transport system substrate-binding protein|nr:ABC transporter substrate-binding protein [Actinomycetota bacterium]